MKKITMFFAVVLLGSCSQKPESSALVLQPKFTVNGREKTISDPVLRTTAFELILNRSTYDQIKKEAELSDYESWKQSLLLTPVRNAGLIEIRLVGSDKEILRKQAAALLHFLESNKSEFTLEGEKGSLDFVILQPSDKN